MRKYNTRRNIIREAVLRSCSFRRLTRLLCIVSTLALVQVLIFIFTNNTPDTSTRAQEQNHHNNPSYHLLADHVSRPDGPPRVGSRTSPPRTLSGSSSTVSNHPGLSSGQSLRLFPSRRQPRSKLTPGIDSSNDLIDSLSLCFMNCSSSNSSIVTSIMTSSMMTYKTQTKCMNRPEAYNQTVVYQSINKKGVRCLMDGTRRVSHGGRCHCKNGWSGESCSIPSIVTNSNYPAEYGVKIRDHPALIVYAFPFSHEFDLLEARVKEYENVVDVYVIVESNYTASGLSKPRLLRDRLERTDYLRTYQSKLVLAELDWFPSDAYSDGWIADELLRTFIVTGGLSRLRGIKEDDVFILTDADEIPTRSALLFLKFHYGYPEPVGFRLRHHVFSALWISPHRPVSGVFGACSFGMLRHVFDGNPYYLRRAPRHLANNAKAVENFRHNRGGRVVEWSFGSEVGEMQAGVHCSWCFDVAGVLTKMTSAHVSDLPRWGDINEYANAEYIAYLVVHGMWFDNKTKLISADSKLSPKTVTGRLFRREIA